MRISLLAVTLLLISTAFSQTTEFTYQGSLKDGVNTANANYDFEFRLFTAVSGGIPLGTLQRLNVPVTNGTFTVALDFGSQFPGTNRFLEISVRPAGGGSFQLLSPRQPVTSAPYSVRSLNAANADTLSGVAASQYVLTTDSRMTDARPPTAGSGNYIQNSLSQQSANFSISGTATVGGTLSGNVVNAATQYNINGQRILATPGSENLFAGADAGASNTIGIENAFFGRLAGTSNSTGSGNSFFGFVAGRLTTDGTNNSFFGSRVGLNNFSGNFNSFFGHRAGEFNNGSVNSFFGTGAGLFNGSGNSNTFVGHDAGNTNSSGSFNTVLGENSDVFFTDLTNATAIGSKALVTQSNSLVLGSINGVNGATADTRVGIGVTAPLEKLHVNGIVRIEALGLAGTTQLCRNASFQVSVCSSSGRYKTNISSFSPGVDLIRHLRPVSFTWKEGGLSDLGLIAEEVAAAEPLLATYDAKGNVEGVKYDRIGVVLINVVKEQQAQIDKQKKRLLELEEMLKRQEAEIRELRSLICAVTRTAETCKP